jgi:hypothetical protein
MKILFLDHDGVICLSSEWGSRLKKTKAYSNPNPGGERSVPVEFRFDNFNKKAIGVLNKILLETDAEIVVSSDWQHFCNLEEMGLYYEMQGIIKKPIAFTGNIIDPAKATWHRDWDSEGTRSLEIMTWLESHPEVTNWVAVDDLNMGKIVKSYSMEFIHEWGLENFVHTPRGNEGIKQVGIKEKILRFLK